VSPWDEAHEQHEEAEQQQQAVVLNPFGSPPANTEAPIASDAAAEAEEEEQFDFLAAAKYAGSPLGSLPEVAFEEDEEQEDRQEEQHEEQQHEKQDDDDDGWLSELCEMESSYASPARSSIDR